MKHGHHPYLPYDPRLRGLARALRKHGTMAEALLWLRVKGKALGVEFHRQVPALDYIIDFYCPEYMLAIEIDGYHHDNDLVYRSDTERQKRLEARGIRFLRFSEQDVRKRGEEVLGEIEGWLREHGHNGIERFPG